MPHGDSDAGRPSVPVDVGERFANHEIQGPFDRWRQRAVGDPDVRGQVEMPDRVFDGRAQAKAEGGRIDTASQVPQLAQGIADAQTDLLKMATGVIVRSLTSRGQGHERRPQLVLYPIVKIGGKLPPGLIARRHEPVG